MDWKDIILLLLLFPLAAYLRDATYKNVHGRNIIKEDLIKLWRRFHRWRQNKGNPIKETKQKK